MIKKIDMVLNYVIAACLVALGAIKLYENPFWGCIFLGALGLNVVCHIVARAIDRKLGIIDGK